MHRLALQIIVLGALILSGFSMALAQTEAVIPLTKEEKAFLQEHPSIKVHMESGYAPFSYIDHDKFVGYSIDYADLIASKLGVEFEYRQNVPWSEAIEGLKSRKVDVIAQMINSEARRKFTLFTEGYYTYYQGIVSRKDNGQYRVLTDLHGKTVGVVQDYYTEDVIREHHKPITIKTYPDNLALLDAVVKGEIHAAVSTHQIMQHNITDLFLKDIVVSRPIVEDPHLSVTQESFGVRKDWPLLHSAIQKAIDATLTERLNIQRKWFGATEKIAEPIKLSSEEKRWLANNSITLSVDDRYAPMNFRETDGSMAGLSVDYIRMIEKKLGVSVNLDARLWPEALANAMAHRTDGIINANSTPERDKKLQFTEPYIEVPQALFTREEAPDYDSLEELKGKRILVKRKTVEAEVLPKRYPSVEIVEVDSFQEALTLLSTGRADAVFGHLIVVNHVLEKGLFTNLKVNHLIFDEAVTKQRIGVRNDNPLLLSVLNKAIQAISEVEHRAIRKRWIDTSFEKQTTTIDLTAEERAWIKAHPEITLGFNPDMPPMVIVGEQGELSGLLLDIYKELEAVTGLKINIDLDEWSSTIRKASDGETDGLLAGVPGLARDSGLTPTKALTRVAPTIYARKDAPFTIESRNDLKGKRIATLKGIHLVNRYLKPIRDSLDVTEVQNGLEMMKMVFEGKVDAAVGFNVHAYFISSHLLLDVKPVHFAHEYQSLFVAGIRSDWPELVSIVNKGLEAIGETRLRAINKKWTGIETRSSQIQFTSEEPLVIPDEVVFKQTAFIIKQVAILFAALLFVMFVYWMAKGRPAQFNIRVTFLFMSVAFTGLIVAVGVLVLMLLQGEQRQEDVDKRLHESTLLAYELKQSSDDLTRFARTFAATGDPRYEKHVHTIMRIRDGKQAHPEGFSQIFWDQLSAGMVELNEAGETYSIEQRMIELGLSDRELEKLKLAKLESDNLINLEEIAMHAVRGYYKDSEGGFTVQGKPNLEMARQLLHGEEYHAAKARIMMPINDFFVLLERRTENELQTERSKNKAVLLAIAGLLALTIIFSIYAFILFQRRIVNPIRRLKKGALIIEGGNYSHQIAIKSQDEFGDLGGHLMRWHTVFMIAISVWSVCST